MKQKDFEKFISELKAVRLSILEKDDIKRKIVSEMEKSSFKFPVEVRPIISPYVFKTFLYSRSAFVGALSLIFVLTTGGSVLAAANKTVPGDFLYPIKVSVNEKISGLFALSPKTQAIRQANLIGERLKESQILAAKGNLVPENRKIIEESIEKHTEQVKSYLRTFEDANDLEQAQIIKNRLEVSIKTNDTIISSIGEVLGTEVEPVAPKLKEEFLNSDDYTQSTSIANLEVSEIPMAADEIAATAQDGQDAISSPVMQTITFPVPEKLIPAASLELARSKLKQSKKSIEVTENLINKSNLSLKNIFLSRLLEVKKEYREGEREFSSGSFAEAAVIFDKTFKDSEELKILLEAAKTLNISIIPGDSKSNDFSDVMM